MAEILTPLQRRVLHGLFQAGAAERGYFLSGGTALSEFYLHHRLSVDLDFFTRRERAVSEDQEWVEEAASGLGLALEWTRTANPTHWRAEFTDPSLDEAPLQVDFANDLVPPVGAPRRHEDVIVDSFEDIAANKISAFYGRGDTDPKDLADLYFILRGGSWNLEYLLELARHKDKTFEDEEACLILAVGLRESIQPQSLARSLARLKFPRAVDPVEMAELIDREASRIIRRLRPGQ